MVYAPDQFCVCLFVGNTSTHPHEYTLIRRWAQSGAAVVNRWDAALKVTWVRIVVRSPLAKLVGDNNNARYFYGNNMIIAPNNVHTI